MAGIVNRLLRILCAVLNVGRGCHDGAQVCVQDKEVIIVGGFPQGIGPSETIVTNRTGSGDPIPSEPGKALHSGRRINKAKCKTAIEKIALPSVARVS